MPQLSSLPMRVDTEDWLDEDLPAVVAALSAALPRQGGSVSLPGCYLSVASDLAVDDAGDGGVLAVVADDDECDREIVGVRDVPADMQWISHLIEQSESMNIAVRRF